MIAEPITNVQLTVTNDGIIEGEPATLTCTAQGGPPIEVSWQKEGRVLRNDTRGQQHIYRLYIEDVQRSDAGKYTCTADNEVKIPVSSNQVTLHVLCKYTHT